jgi:hypothetical protein
VISVQAIVLSLESLQIRRNHNLLKSLSFFFSPALRECGIRGLLYVGMARGIVDERSLEALRRMRKDDVGSRLTLSQFKTLVREQFFMLFLDEAASLTAIPKMLPRGIEARRTAFAAIRDVLSVSGEISGDTATRLARVAELFGVGEKTRDADGSVQAKAS